MNLFKSKPETAAELSPAERLADLHSKRQAIVDKRTVLQEKLTQANRDLETARANHVEEGASALKAGREVNPGPHLREIERLEATIRGLEALIDEQTREASVLLPEMEQLGQIENQRSRTARVHESRQAEQEAERAYREAVAAVEPARKRWQEAILATREADGQTIIRRGW
jgi:rubrerythrin